MSKPYQNYIKTTSKHTKNASKTRQKTPKIFTFLIKYANFVNQIPPPPPTEIIVPLTLTPYSDRHYVCSTTENKKTINTNGHKKLEQQFFTLPCS
jgi:hypothetical protein